MRIAVIADLHANLEATLAVFEALDRLSLDRTICLGDVVGYNANPNEVVDIVRDRGIPSIMGNHDAVVCGLEEPWFFNSRAQKAVQWQAPRLRDDNREWLRALPEQALIGDALLATHGSPGSRDEYILDWLDAMRQTQFLDGTPIRVCFFGHSHHAVLFGEKGSECEKPAPERYSLNPNNRYFINGGAVGQPRDRDPRAAFGVFDSDAMIYEFHRVEYDIDATAGKILAAGLPPQLAERLYKGR